eukprot:1160006-Pelagomonas_calceolata.AAC.8
MCIRRHSLKTQHGAQSLTASPHLSTHLLHSAWINPSSSLTCRFDRIADGAAPWSRATRHSEATPYYLDRITAKRSHPMDAVGIINHGVHDAVLDDGHELAELQVVVQVVLRAWMHEINKAVQCLHIRHGLANVQAVAQVVLSAWMHGITIAVPCPDIGSKP